MIKKLEAVKVQHQAIDNEFKAESIRDNVPIETFVWGSFESRIYPWVPVEMLTRSAENINAANEMLKSYSDNLEIRNSSLGNSQCFGMFAKKDIKTGELVLDSRTPLGVSSLDTQGRCYNCSESLASIRPYNFLCCPKMQFCSDECFRLADTYYHQALCGKNFDYIYEGTGGANLDIRLYLRVLAIVVQSGQHPLDNSLLSWMTAQSSDYGLAFSLDTDVIAPMRILQELGADIFDPKYDQWILMIIRYLEISYTQTHFKVD